MANPLQQIDLSQLAANLVANITSANTNNVVIAGNTSNVTIDTRLAPGTLPNGNLDIQTISANYGIKNTDSGTLLYSNAAANSIITFYIDTVANARYAIGTNIMVLSNVGSTNVVPNSGVTMTWVGVGNTGHRILANAGICTLIMPANDTWFITGTVLS